MTCLECGGAMRTRREVVPFDKPIGLPGVRLTTSVARCQKCGAFEVLLPNLDGLHQAILWPIIGSSTCSRPWREPTRRGAPDGQGRDRRHVAGSARRRMMTTQIESLTQVVAGWRNW